LEIRCFVSADCHLHTTKAELYRRNSASFRLHMQNGAVVVVEGANVTPLQHGATTMLALGLLLNTVGLGVICWLIFTLAVYVLPFIVALNAGFWAYHSGAGVLGTPIVAVAAGGITLAIAQIAFAMTQSLMLRAVIAAVFALPATLVGYHLALAMAHFGVPSPAWQQVFACLGAVFIGGTAWTRLTILTEPLPLNSNAAVGSGPQPVLTAAAHQK
jgi:hypothetical protein